jgi:hypothetical protein
MGRLPLDSRGHHVVPLPGLPGSEERLAELERRAELGLRLFSACDKPAREYGHARVPLEWREIIE